MTDSVTVNGVVWRDVFLLTKSCQTLAESALEKPLVVFRSTLAKALARAKPLVLYHGLVLHII